MRRIIYSLVLGLAVTLCLASVAFAESYSVDVVIDGKTVTLLVNTDNDSLVIDTKSPGVQIKSITQIAIVPTQTVTGTQQSALSESQSFSEMSEDERLTALNYVSKTSVIAAKYNSTLAMITLLLKQMTIAPTIAFTDDWRNQMTTQSEEIKNIGKDIQSLTAPTIFQPAHELLLAASAHFDSSIDLLNEALDTFDRNTINRAAEEMQAGSDTIMKAGKKIDEIKVSLNNFVERGSVAPTIVSTSTLLLEINTTPEPTESITTITDSTASNTAIITISQSMNVRSGPGIDYSLLGSAYQGESFTAKGKNPTGDWYLIDYKGREGWLYVALINITYGENVPVIDNIVPAPTATPTPQPLETYVVQGGETLEAIAERFGVTVDGLALANNLNNTDFLFPGVRLMIPTQDMVVKLTESVKTRPITNGAFLASQKKLFAIDADLEEWSDEWVPIEFITQGKDNYLGTKDISGYFQAAWSNQGILIAVNIVDDYHSGGVLGTDQWQWDSIEISFDREMILDYDNSIATEDDYQIVITFDPELTIANFHQWLPTRHDGIANALGAVTATDVGYRAEFLLPWAVLGFSDLHPAIGQSFGFNISVNDNDSSSSKQDTVLSVSPSRKTYNNPTEWGTLTIIQ